MTMAEGVLRPRVVDREPDGAAELLGHREVTFIVRTCRIGSHEHDRSAHSFSACEPGPSPRCSGWRPYFASGCPSSAHLDPERFRRSARNTENDPAPRDEQERLTQTTDQRTNGHARRR